MKALKWSQYFSHYKSIGIFPNSQGQVPGRIPLNFEPIQDIMGLLVACKNEEDPIKNELEWSQHYSLIFKMLKGS